MTAQDIPTYNPQGSEADPRTPEGKVHLFDLAGKRYYMDEHVPPNVTFAYLRDVRSRGTDYAVANLIYATMGDEAMDALAESEDMSEADAKSIFAIIQKHAMGQIERLTGK